MSDQTEQQATFIPRADNFGRRLALLRSVLDLTMQEAADACGLKKPTWAYWEAHPDREPRNFLEVVTAISNAFNVDREWLLWGDTMNPCSSDTPASTSTYADVEESFPFRPLAWWEQEPDLADVA